MLLGRPRGREILKSMKSLGTTKSPVFISGLMPPAVAPPIASLTPIL